MSDQHRITLLVLDAQENMLKDPPQGVPAAAELRCNIQEVLDVARRAIPLPQIIHVRNCGDAGEPDEPNTEGWELTFAPLADEHVIDKRKNNAFTGTNLNELIKSDAEVIIIGAQSDFCVKATCKAALARGNQVVIIQGAHGTYDRNEFLYGRSITPASSVEAEIESELDQAGVNVFGMKDLESLFNDR